MSDHSNISAQPVATAPAAAKDVMHAKKRLQNESEIQSSQKISIQFKLSIGAVDDPLEHEADTMADTILRMPGQNFIQRKCSHCEEEEKLQRKPLESFIQRKGSSADATASDAISNKINAGRGSGNSMDINTQNFMQSRFGADFSDVKIHTGGEAIQMNRELNAKAFTVKNDIYFNDGQYDPNSDAGKHLLAHELTHTVQQSNTQSLIQRSWEIMPRTTANPLRAGGLTDEQLLENAFGEICPLTSRTGNIISLVPGPPPANRMEGCDCLRDIDAAIGTPAITSNPKVRVEPNGWSQTMASGGALEVSVRHPDDPFSWGYWTGTSPTHPTETRHIKPFWQTLAHEVCGHGATFARSRGSLVGARGSSTGHNDAIIGENQVAAEHAVVTDEQRGLDINPATATPMPGHRGESFLQAIIPGFTHADAVPPASAAAVVSSVINTINTTTSGSGLNLMIQVEGRAFGNEGGTTMANRRAAAIRAQITGRLRAAGISLTVSGSSRFHPDQSAIVAGSSASGTGNPARAVMVYLFHKAHSAGP